jgi:hypothetical protein
MTRADPTTLPSSMMQCPESMRPSVVKAFAMRVERLGEEAAACAKIATDLGLPLAEARLREVGDRVREVVIDAERRPR